jgi:small-conductance mechanosensitive channel
MLASRYLVRSVAVLALGMTSLISRGLAAAEAAADAITPDAVLPVAVETSAWARFEPGLMILAATLVLVIGGLLLRVLVRLGVVRNVAWLVPILMLLSGLSWAGLHAVRLAPDLPKVMALLQFIFLALVFVSILYPVARLALPEPAQRTRGGVPPLIRAVALAIVTFLGVLILFTWNFPGLSLTPLFLTSGAVSIVLGLAVQDLLSNLLAGVVMGLERPFKLGDWVKISEIEGEVVNIAWRATTVRTREHDCVIIPNNVSVREKVTNFDMPTPVHMLKVPVGVGYETPCGLVVSALEEAAARVVGVLDTPAVEVHLLDYLDSAMLYELRAYIDNYASAPAVHSDLNKEIWYALKRHGITIPFPQRDVNLRQVIEEPKARQARLLATRGPLRGTMAELGSAELIIGRSLDCGICIPDPSVSNHHASIEATADGHRLKDLGSRHGTLLNDGAVLSATLQQGDEIRIGPVTFVYECLWRNHAGRPDAVWAPTPEAATPVGPTGGDTVGESGAFRVGARPDAPAR